VSQSFLVTVSASTGLPTRTAPQNRTYYKDLITALPLTTATFCRTLAAVNCSLAKAGEKVVLSSDKICHISKK